MDTLCSHSLRILTLLTERFNNMKASELRIGNWLSVYGLSVDIGGWGGWREIPIDMDDILTCTGHPNWYKGIPITEQWLLKLGFTEAIYTDGERYLQLDKTDYKRGPYDYNIYNWQCYRFREYKGDWYFEVHETNRDHKPAIQMIVKYVHTLQNLFYALRNEELIIKG